ncbi:hypothetical protein QQP08_009432 [Theobroma cacao]|nr:hypothetical protein QQP08_009432 [Theobroma cacao]
MWLVSWLMELERANEVTLPIQSVWIVRALVCSHKISAELQIARKFWDSEVEIRARKCCAINLRWIFPLAVFGRESVIKTFLGTLKAARFFLQNSCSSASPILHPSLGTIVQFI